MDNLNAMNGCSLVVQFDELHRNSTVLKNSSEDEFYRFVLNAEVNRRRWENAEIECQRLSIELTKASQEKTCLEEKLNLARSMLDNESYARKKAEVEAKLLSERLEKLRKVVMDDHLVDEVKLDKLKNFDHFESQSDDFFSAEIATPKGILKNCNVTEQSVRDVEDFSFDDTRDLCDSTSLCDYDLRGRMRKRSGTHQQANGEVEVNGGHPNGRRSTNTNKRSRESVFGQSGNSPDKNRQDDVESAVGGGKTLHCNHNFVTKALLKKDNCCGLCGKRLKFGKIGVKCTICKIMLHSECKEPSSPQVSRTPIRARDRSPSCKRQYFQSPMLA